MKKMLMFVCAMALLWSTQAVADMPEPGDVDFFATWTRIMPLPELGTWIVPKIPEGWAMPHWDDNRLEVFVDNEYRQHLWKLVWVKVDWLSIMNKPVDAPDLKLIVDGAEIPLLSVTPNSDGWSGWTWKWQVTPQPASEIVRFPDDRYYHLDPMEGQGLRSVSIATLCVPEPATLALLGIGGVTLLRRKR